MTEQEQLNALWNGAGRSHLVEQTRPTPEPHEVVLEVEAAGICGSDLYFYGALEEAETVPGGHEAAGTVVSTGSGVLGLDEGDRVAVEMVGLTVACMRCGSAVSANTSSARTAHRNPGEVSARTWWCWSMRVSSCRRRSTRFRTPRLSRSRFRFTASGWGIARLQQLLTEAAEVGIHQGVDGVETILWQGPHLGSREGLVYVIQLGQTDDDPGDVPVCEGIPDGELSPRSVAVADGLYDELRPTFVRSDAARCRHLLPPVPDVRGDDACG